MNEEYVKQVTELVKNQSKEREDLFKEMLGDCGDIPEKYFPIIRTMLRTSWITGQYHKEEHHNLIRQYLK